MSAKTIFVIIVTAFLTLLLVKNTDDMDLWILGNSSVPKLAVLGGMLAIGFIFGFLAGRPGTKKEAYRGEPDDEESDEPYLKVEKRASSQLSDEDRDYIS